MTNGEKYKTAEERVDAFNKWCHSQECAKCPIQSKCRETNDGSFYWLDIEAENEKPLPCPFCGNDVHITCENGKFSCRCSCGYSSTEENKSSSDAISAHNRVAKFVND